MELAVSNSIKVSCDICGDEMKKQGDTYACYPCKHMLYESEISDHQVKLNEESLDERHTRDAVSGSVPKK